MIKKEIDKKEDIRKIVKLCHLSAYLIDEEQLSLMLIAPPENGKTHFLMSYEDRLSINVTDLSFMGLVHNLQRNLKFKSLKIPDFLKITGKKRSTSQNLLTLLNGFLEEGLFKIDLGNKEEINFKGRRGGILTATTNKSYSQNRKTWEGMGFSSRFLICSYKYSSETIYKIMKLINKGKTKKQKAEKIKSKRSLVISEDKFNQQLNKISVGLRQLIQLQTLAKANALNENRLKVIQKDINEVIRLHQYLNLDYTEI